MRSLSDTVVIVLSVAGTMAFGLFLGAAVAQALTGVWP